MDYRDLKSNSAEGSRIDTCLWTVIIETSKPPSIHLSTHQLWGPTAYSIYVLLLEIQRWRHGLCPQDINWLVEMREKIDKQTPDSVQFIQSGWVFLVGAPSFMWKVGGCEGQFPKAGDIHAEFWKIHEYLTRLRRITKSVLVREIAREKERKRENMVYLGNCKQVSKPVCVCVCVCVCTHAHVWKASGTPKGTRAWNFLSITLKFRLSSEGSRKPLKDFRWESSMIRFVFEEDCSSCSGENDLQPGRTEAGREVMYMMEEVMRT